MLVFVKKCNPPILSIASLNLRDGSSIDLEEAVESRLDEAPRAHVLVLLLGPDQLGAWVAAGFFLEEKRAFFFSIKDDF